MTDTLRNPRNHFVLSIVRRTSFFAVWALWAFWAAFAVCGAEDAATPNAEQATAESPDAEKAGPAAGTFRKEADSPAVYFKNARGEEIPIVDSRGRVIFQRPEDKPIEEMTEEDFYKTLSPAEKAVLAKEPKTAPDWLRAAVQIARFGRKRFAAILLEKSISAEGTPAEFAALLDDLGPDKLFQFGTDIQMGEKGKAALDRVMTEARKYWESPETIREAFERTLRGSEDERVKAMLDVRKGGIAAFGILLEELYGDDPERSVRAKELLNRLGDYAKEGLLAELATEDSDKLTRLADVFADMPNLPDLSPLLIRYYDETLTEEAKEALGKAIIRQAGAIPDRPEAAERIAAFGRRFFLRTIPLGPSADGTRTIWLWNAETGAAESKTLSDEEVYRIRAAYLLHGASKVDHSNRQIAAEAAVALGERILYDNGLDNPPDTDRFQREFGAISNEELLAALEWSLKSGRSKGGVIPTLLLGKTGEKSLVLGQNGPTALVRAACAPDRRLRFAALEAIDAIAPETSYPGSANVVNALLHFASASGKRFALIGVSKLENGSLIGNCFSDSTVRVMPVTSGGTLIRLAQENADVEYAVAVSYLNHPDPRTVCQTLAADYRTSDIPIYVGIENETYIEQAEHYAGQEPNAVALPLPSDRESGAWALAELYKKVNPEQVPVGRRLEQARRAVSMLTRRLGENQTFSEPEMVERIAVDFLRRPEIRVEALEFAGNVKSSRVQTALGDAVQDRRIPLEARRLFLESFVRHVQKFGMLLRGPDLRRFYDAYNATESFPVAEQKIHSDLLDAIEGKIAAPEKSSGPEATEKQESPDVPEAEKEPEVTNTPEAAADVPEISAVPKATAEAAENEPKKP